MTVPPITNSPKDDVITYNSEDFSKVDHRLKLYLMMKVLSGNEEVHLTLRVKYLQYYSNLILVSLNFRTTNSKAVLLNGKNESLLFMVKN